MSAAQSDTASGEHTPCVVIGAGPAGISAAQWLQSFEVPFRWISTDGTVGGMLHRVHNHITNYPGANYSAGGALIDAFEAQLDHSDLSRPESGHVRRLRYDTSRWHITFLDHPPLTTDAIILATGTRYRTLGVPGEREAMGRCVSQSATADGEHFGGEDVAVVGGGDAGFENALRLAEHGCKVWMLLRNDQFKARESFVARVKAHPNIEFYPFPTFVTEVQPDVPNPGGCRLLLDVAGRRQSLDVSCLFVRIGVDPVKPQIEPGLEVNDGFIVVDRYQRTSQDGIFAAGDITACSLRSVASAVGSGATAAKSVGQWLRQL